MKLLMPGFEAAFIDVGVNLGGSDVGMTEHHLEGSGRDDKKALSPEQQQGLTA